MLGHILEFFGGISPDFITPNVINAYKTKRVNEGGEIYRQINMEILNLQALVKWAKETGYCTSEPVKVMPCPMSAPYMKCSP